MADDSDTDELEALATELEGIMAGLKELMPQVAQARRAHFKQPDDTTLAAMETVERQANERLDRMNELHDRLQQRLGLSDEALEAIQSHHSTGDEVDRRPRSQLTVDKLAPTSHIEDRLAASLDELWALVGPRRLQDYAEQRRPVPPADGIPLSLVRGLRPESEDYPSHRFGQAVQATLDFLDDSPNYDHFGGAVLVPQMASLAAQAVVIQEISGGTKRLRSLWHKASRQVEATLFELLVGAACASRGRQVEFLEPSADKTPDLMCHDPYPLAIECKRKQPLSTYEIEEERHMRRLFLLLETEARRRGMWGCFHLQLGVEASQAPLQEIVERLMQLRFAAGTEVHHGWGRIRYDELPDRMDLPSQTRLYSPNMLRQVFSWESDLSGADGLVCRVSNDRAPRLQRVEQPVGLLWTNRSAEAERRRAWGPMSLVSEALQQIPPGDFGIVYVAYQEGAREAMADERLQGFEQWVREADHRNNIRVPMCQLVRLYPRALGDGRPDLIESTVTYKAGYCDDMLPELLPSRVFTAS